jgi:hypothetical protein
MHVDEEPPLKDIGSAAASREGKGSYSQVRGIDYSGVRPSSGAAGADFTACGHIFQHLRTLVRCCARGRAHSGAVVHPGGCSVTTGRVRIAVFL